MMSGIERIYRPAGPTLERFHSSRGKRRILIGPYGSGKTSACCMEIHMIGQRQAPDSQGIRRTRGAILRSTYGRLESNFLPTWEKWFRSRIVHSRPMRTVVNYPSDDGTRVNMEVYFIALDHPDDVTAVEGMELTWLYANEVREIHWVIVDKFRGRVGRYPDRDTAPITWSGFLADTNCPDPDHWLWLLKEAHEPGWDFFHQPGALVRKARPDGTWAYAENPLAENVYNLPEGFQYYWNMLPGADEDVIRVNVLSEPGNLFTGRPVYEPWWNERFHVSETPLEISGLPLYFGWDYGLTPAATAAQVTPRGQVRVVREFVCDDGALDSFVDTVVLPALAQHPVMSCLDRRSWGDPSGGSRAPTDADTCEAVLNRRGFKVVSAATNDFDRRRRAVIRPLQRVIGGQPGLIVDPSCRRLIAGFNGGYQFDRIRTSMGAAKYHDVPLKNEFSHISEGLQYLCLGVLTPEGGISDGARDKPLPQPQFTGAGMV